MIRREPFDPPDLGEFTVELSEADTASLEALERHLTQCAVEYLAQVNETRPSWTVYPALPPDGDGRHTDWRVDEAVDHGEIVLAREPDGLRVEVDVHVAVGAQRTARRGVMPDDGWPEVAPQ